FALLLWAAFMIGGHIMGTEAIYSEIGRLRAINALALTAVSVSLAFLIGQFVRKTLTLTGVVQTLALGLAFISGVFVPQELLADGVLAAARFTPTYWYVRSNDMLNASVNADMDIFLQGTLIQLGFAIALFAIALVLGREKRAKG
ncbi:MAG: ABC transporter permease, partial [Defluviitaleaceae bacterium]|nr:ABC transporter permease [Defluviitaleaceae bacterium]